jgi:hypothetical protein
MSLHGIRTGGAWQKALAPEFAEAGFLPVPLDFGWFSAVKLLLPWSRKRQIDWFRDEHFQKCELYGCSRPSIVAHSFGTYLVASAIKTYMIQFDRLIFCGAIVRRDYPWTQTIDHGLVHRVLNDFGRLDFWARVVAWVVPDAGQSGLRGFDDTAGGRVVQREHPEFRHGDYFYIKNYRERWIPFLRGNDPPERPEFPKPRVNWRVRVTLGALLISCLVGCLLWYFYHYASNPVVPDNAAPDTPAQAVLRLMGVVVDDASHDAISGVTVTILNWKNRDGSLARSESNSRGEFEFNDLIADKVPEFIRLLAHKAGYIDEESHPSAGSGPIRIQLHRDSDAKENE